jgi:hypothetical protein
MPGVRGGERRIRKQTFIYEMRSTAQKAYSRHAFETGMKEVVPAMLLDKVNQIVLFACRRAPEDTKRTRTRY